MEQLIAQGTHFVEYANGTFAEYVRKRIVVGDDGVKVYKLMLKPSLELMDIHDLRVGENLDQFEMIEKDYNFNDVHIIREDPTHGRIWIETDFEGEPTPFSLRTDSYKEQIRHLQQSNAILKAQMASLVEENKKVLTAGKEHMKDMVGIIEEARKAGGKITREEAEEGGVDQYDR